ncbi:MAG: MBL fold metallo-hydrolase [bacterium]|nr:MBL fold metallo-hydrolase [bacterium]
MSKKRRKNRQAVKQTGSEQIRGSVETLSEHLFWIADTCSVYGVRANGKTLLIDCGTGIRPGADRGAGSVEQVFLTHFHRDQCASAPAWQTHGAGVVVPFSEKRFYEEADLLRAGYDIYDNYTSYYPTFGPLQDVTPEGYAHDYEALTWQGMRFEVVPLPGHTFGSVGYLFEVDGERVLACGDLMSAPGKMHEYYSSQWRYMDFQGHAQHLESLKRAEALGVDRVLPGHGVPFEATREAFGELRSALEELYALFHGRRYEYFHPVFRRLTPHVVEVSNAEAKSYLICDDAGHAVMIDCGYTDHARISANPHRFIDHLTPHLERELGIRTVEWFLPSHYHDDHLAGLPALQAKYGTQVVSSPELKDILEHPERYDMPCLVPRETHVDQVVNRGEAFQWRGIDFYMEQHPGQTLYHHLIRFEVDRRRFLSIGDNISGACFREKRDYIHSFIPKNRTPVSSYGDMPRQILEAQPHVLLTGHGGAVLFDEGKTERWQEWMDRWQALFTQILDQPHADMGMDPHWVEFYPYKVRIQPGETVRYTVTVRNYEEDVRVCALRFRSVEGVGLEPQEVEMRVRGGESSQCEVEARFPEAFKTHSLPVVADVTWNGQALGEIAEAIAYW